MLHRVLLGAAVVALALTSLMARPAEAVVTSSYGPHVLARSGPYVAEATDYLEKAASGPYKGLLRGHTVVTYRTAKAPSYGDTTIYNQMAMVTAGGVYYMPDSGYNRNFFDNKHTASAYSKWGCPPTMADPNVFQSRGYLIDGKFPNGVRFLKKHNGGQVRRNCPEPG